MANVFDDSMTLGLCRSEKNDIDMQGTAERAPRRSNKYGTDIRVTVKWALKHDKAKEMNYVSESMNDDVRNELRARCIQGTSSLTRKNLKAWKESTRNMSGGSWLDDNLGRLNHIYGQSHSSQLTVLKSSRLLVDKTIFQVFWDLYFDKSIGGQEN